MTLVGTKEHVQLTGNSQNLMRCASHSAFTRALKEGESPLPCRPRSVPDLWPRHDMMCVTCETIHCKQMNTTNQRESKREHHERLRNKIAPLSLKKKPLMTQRNARQAITLASRIHSGCNATSTLPSQIRPRGRFATNMRAGSMKLETSS